MHARDEPLHRLVRKELQSTESLLKFRSGIDGHVEEDWSQTKRPHQDRQGRVLIRVGKMSSAESHQGVELFSQDILGHCPHAFVDDFAVFQEEDRWDVANAKTLTHVAVVVHVDLPTTALPS